jgi:phenylalanyl-tRNA synthetase beta chain
VRVRLERINALLGANLDADDVAPALERVSGSIIVDDPGVWLCPVPEHRHDLEREVDFIEEIARIVGLDRVPSRVVSWPAPSSEVDSAHDAVLDLKRCLVAQGFYEVVTNPLGAVGNGVDLVNPMTSDQTGLRASVREHLLRVAAANLDAGNRGLRLFEVGRVFRDGGEAWHLGLLVTGPAFAAGWNAPERALDAYDITGVALAEGLAELDLEQVSPAELKRLGIKQPVAFAETSLTGWVTRPPVTYAAWPPFPASSRDAAVVVPRARAYAEIQRATVDLGEPLLEEVTLVDVFTDDTGTRLDAGLKSLTLTFRYRSAERTLTDKEVNDAHDRVRARLRELTGCDYRA